MSYQWDSGPVDHREAAKRLAELALGRDFNGDLVRFTPLVPDPATLSWLLRKASLDLWRSRLALNRLRGTVGTNAGFAALRNFDTAYQTKRWLADIIREHGQEGTE